MSEQHSARRAFVEPLEARIAPAGVLTANWKSATFGAPIELFAGDGLSTGGANSGTYLLYVEKGAALVFLTDLNNNGEVDYNEVTGIAAGNGLRLTSFVDIHGDITTNLVQVTGTISGISTTRLALTDSDSNRSNDFRNLGDGRILANSTIESITMRALKLADLPDQNGDSVVDDRDVAVRQAYTTHSIFGDIVAGRGFGATDGGLTIDTLNESGISTKFGFDNPFTPPSVGSIRVGTAASGHFFSYGASNADDINGTFVKFTPANGQNGGDIIGIRSATGAAFNLDGLYAGDGGLGARGGNISDVTIPGDDTGGYEVIAGRGGRGSTGGTGGSILNFTDLGSETSNVVIRSGSGGPSTTGAGGNAGAFSVGTFNVFGNISIALGSGGDGFTAGGNGAALTKGIFNQPTPTDTFVPGNGVGTMHNPLEIGTTSGIDFDNDGLGDMVFTVKETNALVVQLGNGLGGVRTIALPDGSSILDRVYLSGARNAEALTVGDFNGDGRPDVAAASRDEGSQAGIVVFLNKGTEDQNLNGTLDAGEDLDGDGQIDFLGFHPGRYSNIAGLDTGDPQTGNQFFAAWLGPVQISSLTSGDYDGDGKTEIAAILTNYLLKGTDANSGLTTSLGREVQTLIYLTPDEEFNNSTQQVEFTGQFYMDFGTRRQVVNGVEIPPEPKLPFIQLTAVDTEAANGNFNSVVIETSALTNSDTYDVIFVGVRSDNRFRTIDVIDYSDRSVIITPTVPFSTPPLIVGSYVFGRVDTNRDQGGSDKTSPTDYTLRDFTVLDFDADGLSDVVVLSAAPALYLVGIKGDGTGSGTPDSGLANADNAGNFFGAKGRNLQAPELMAVRTVDGDRDGQFDDLAVLDSTGDWVVSEYRSGIMPTDAPNSATTGVRVLRTFVGTAFVADAGEEFLTDTFVPDLAFPEEMSVFVSSFDTGNPFRNTIYADPVDPASGLLPATFTMSERGFRLNAGDGGNALVGKGGVGGLIGSGSTLATVIDPLTGLSVTDLIGSVQFNITGTARIFAGNGGDGFTAGGKGGTISGVVVRLPGIDPLDDNSVVGAVAISASLVAGDGGRGFSGAGGAGGDLTQNSIAGGIVFLAGDGGQGRVGGAGGNVFGNGSSVYDARALSVRVVAGNGGDGARGGGAGGVISGFSPVVGSPSVPNPYFLTYIAGDGGDAVAGAGGRGGSILNSSPREGDGIQGEIFIEAGDGGDGLTGGNGGGVTNFVSKPATNSKKPAILSILGGHGGDGLAGSGGNGGSISSITVPTRGGVGNTSQYTFSRIIAGNGGDSTSSRGGNGGNVSDVTGTGASEGSFAIVGGAGGDGLWAGGHGGSVLRVDLFLPASAATKALIVGGEGGNAGAFIANTNDSAPNQAQRAFGGRIGIGGNGGSITDFTQRGNIGSHFDFIAGNGGDTLNYGSLKDTKAYVGKGGSIGRIKVSGDIGNVQVDDPNTPLVNETIPIKSYNDILNGETMADFVNANLRAPLGGFELTDSAGNVGIVVGTAGLNKRVVTDVGQPTKYVPLPAPGTVNGNLVDVEARNILSAIAGNVDRIARIQIAQNIRVLGGIIGGDKGVIGQNDYLDSAGVLTVDGRPVLDGRLVDGALVARSILSAFGKPTTLLGRVYSL